MNHQEQEALARWRLILGRYASKQVNPTFGSQELRMERALDFLYGREYRNRGIRGRDESPGEKPGGSLDASQLSVPHWLSEVRELFPKETIETIEKHALDRYNLTDLLSNAEALEKLEPNEDLLKSLLTFKGSIKGPALDAARKIIRQIVEELKERLAREIRSVFAGRLNRFQSSPLKVAQNFDWHGTIKANLKNYQKEQSLLVIERLKFFSRVKRQLPWRIILCVDQSGSMASSVIHSAVLASILAGLPSVSLNLVVFDTSIVDLSGYADDPVETLMSVQLGGGTDIGQAMEYCEKLVEFPQRTIFALISDFCEGAPPSRMLAATKRMSEAGVTQIGLASLDDGALPFYDHAMAERLVQLGMDVTAATPKEFAKWLVNVMS